jgi:hypothetical protein
MASNVKDDQQWGSGGKKNIKVDFRYIFWEIDGLIG